MEAKGEVRCRVTRLWRREQLCSNGYQRLVVWWGTREDEGESVGVGEQALTWRGVAGPACIRMSAC